MSPIDNSKEKPLTQGVHWDEEEWKQLEGRLPAGWKDQAGNQGAWQRVRKLACVADLLRALLVYALCGSSMNQVGMWATLVGIGSLSQRAWRKRVEKSSQWIAWMLAELLASLTPADWLPRGGRVLLGDGSRIKQVGGSGDDVRMHCAYDLQSGRLAHLEVTDRHVAESVSHFGLRKGDVIVTDAGYALGSQLGIEAELGVWGVHRVAPHLVTLEREDGTRISLKHVVRHQKYGTIGSYRVWVVDSKQEKRFEVRLIISMLPRQAAMAARARKRKRLQRKKGPKANLESVWWAGVQIVVTTLPQEVWDARLVVRLYRARWQIELFFKRLKNGLKLYLLPMKQWERAQTYVQLCVLAWALQEQDQQCWREELMEVTQEPDVPMEAESEQEEEKAPWVASSWKLAQLGLLTLRTQLVGSWTRARIKECEAELARYLGSRDRRRRPSQQAQVHEWLPDLLLAPQMQVPGC